MTARGDVSYTWLRWCNKALLALAALAVIAIVVHVAAAIVDEQSKGPDCWECPFPAVAHWVSAYLLGAIVLVWFPFVMWAGAWPTPGNARALGLLQFVVAGLLFWFGIYVVGALLPVWAGVLNLLWLAGAIAHGLAVLVAPGRLWHGASATAPAPAGPAQP